MSRSHKQRDEVYAILRFDGFLSPNTCIEYLVTVKEVLFDQKIAEAEVVRLNALNEGMGCLYWCQVTRLFPNRCIGGVRRDGSPHRINEPDLFTYRWPNWRADSLGPPTPSVVISSPPAPTADPPIRHSDASDNRPGPSGPGRRSPIRPSADRQRTGPDYPYGRFRASCRRSG